MFVIDERSQIPSTLNLSWRWTSDGFERTAHNYVQYGMLDLFAALPFSRVSVIAGSKYQHRSVDLAAFMREIDRSVPPDLDFTSWTTVGHKPPVVGT